MLYTIPDYYKEFQCTADKCEDTCCAGWQIVIDEKSLRKYRRIRGDFMKRMLSSVNWLNGTFRQDKNKRCAFLNERNLCDLYLSQGEGGFCKTCRLYPRHIEEFEGVREITLSISCPEVARILMNKKEPVTFLSYERNGEEEYEDFDPFLFSLLEDARKEMIAILQNRSLPLQQRVVLVLGMAHDMQGRINRQQMFECASIIEKYTGEKAVKYVKEFLETYFIRKKAVLMSSIQFRKLYRLEVLREDWKYLLDETAYLLYAYGNHYYEKQRDDFKKWEKMNPDIEIQLEQLMVYFLFTYLPGAVYDGEIYAKVQMAAFCVWMIEELWMARWLRNQKQLDLEERIELVYRFSREVEHSDLNLKEVERMMKKKWL